MARNPHIVLWLKGWGLNPLNPPLRSASVTVYLQASLAIVRRSMDLLVVMHDGVGKKGQTWFTWRPRPP